MLIFRLKYMFVAGEHCDYETRLWAQEHFKVTLWTGKII